MCFRDRAHELIAVRVREHALDLFGQSNKRRRVCVPRLPAPPFGLWELCYPRKDWGALRKALKNITRPADAAKLAWSLARE